MAKRPVFVPSIGNHGLVRVVMVNFVWSPGLSLSQKQKSIASLHHEAEQRDLGPILEISTKSLSTLGRALSAFNLPITTHGAITASVESVFQASKVFEHGGPFIDLLTESSRSAKSDIRLKSSGCLQEFRWQDDHWSLQPVTAFYDWLYLHALLQAPALSAPLLEYAGFTDIEFNPARSLNCQASAAALFVTLSKRGLLEKALATKESYLRIISERQAY